MAPVFPLEIFQLAIDGLDPPTLAGAARTCKAFLELCRARLAQHRLWHRKYEYVRKGDVDILRLACTVVQEPDIAWRMRSFSDDILEMHIPNRHLDVQAREGSDLRRFLKFELSTKEDEISTWVKNMRRSSDMTPTMTTLLLRATRMRFVSVRVENVQSPFLQRIMTKNRL